MLTLAKINKCSRSAAHC